MYMYIYIIIDLLNISRTQDMTRNVKLVNYLICFSEKSTQSIVTAKKTIIQHHKGYGIFWVGTLTIDPKDEIELCAAFVCYLLCIGACALLYLKAKESKKVQN